MSDLKPYELGEINSQMSAMGKFADIYEAKKDPDILVKEFDSDNLEEIKKAYAFIKNNFSDFTPRHQLVIFAEDGQPTPAIITERVQPAQMKDYRKTAEKLENLLVGAVTLYLKNFNAGFIPDISKTENLLYGTTRSNPEPKWYLIDTFPVLCISVKELRESLGKITDPFMNYYQFPKINQLINLLNQKENEHKKS